MHTNIVPFLKNLDLRLKPQMVEGLYEGWVRFNDVTVAGGVAESFLKLDYDFDWAWTYFKVKIKKPQL